MADETTIVDGQTEEVMTEEQKTQDKEAEERNTRVLEICDSILDLMVSKEVSLIDLQIVPMYLQNIIKGVWLQSEESKEAVKLENQYYAKNIKEVFKKQDTTVTV